MPFSSDERFRTTTAETYRSHARTAERRGSFSSKDDRKNNPQSSRHFRVTRLPSGNVIPVPTVDGLDGVNTRPTSVPQLDLPKTGNSTQRDVFQGQQWDPWQRGNTARYGNKQELWVNKAQPSSGIAPVIHKKDMTSMRRASTSNQDTYRSQGFDLDRDVHDLTERQRQEIIHVVGNDAADYVEDWIRTATTEQAVTVISLMEDLSLKLDAARLGAPHRPRDGGDDVGDTHPPVSPTSSVTLPEIERISYMGRGSGRVAHV